MSSQCVLWWDDFVRIRICLLYMNEWLKSGSKLMKFIWVLSVAVYWHAFLSGLCYWSSFCTSSNFEWHIWSSSWCCINDQIVSAVISPWNFDKPSCNFIRTRINMLTIGINIRLLARVISNSQCLNGGCTWHSTVAMPAWASYQQ